MNLHPIVVHFPVACLVLYSILEITSLLVKKWSLPLRTTKLFLLYIGVATTWAALQTGEIAEELIGGSELVHQHEEYAEKTYLTYMIIAGIYLVRLLGSWFSDKIPSRLQPVVKLAKHPAMSRLIVFAALVGMILLSITGALGGAISHGVAADPVIEFVYGLVMGK